MAFFFIPYGCLTSSDHHLLPPSPPLKKPVIQYCVEPFKYFMLHSNLKQSPTSSQISAEGFLQEDSNTVTLVLLVGYSVLLKAVVNL